MKEIYFAGGCFWGTQHFFKQIDGVVETQTGFVNGNISGSSDISSDTAVMQCIQS